MGFWKTSIALFDLGKKMPPRKGGGGKKWKNWKINSPEILFKKNPKREEGRGGEMGQGKKMRKYHAEEKGQRKKEEKGREKGKKKEKRRKKEKKKEEKEGIEGKNLVWGKICSEKMGLGKKNGLWENLYSPFRFGEKKMPPRKGGGNEKFGKYIALDTYLLFSGQTM